ncbi:FAD-dependent oxidoreductase [Streptomyces sp. DG2A-72]|uniref:phytoene desaturase family protein n=1 Tax=Streptomyces sp. DG2A-72 TaxID=3051386 RepID=UPI00265C6F39|nr:FAD-dependent oxidoreductase [Streptomyces sp. DG2A-72]MDO0937283.1 FAD-dependent oxidoreductase [Streptomyces sp. DG2A-72]
MSNITIVGGGLAGLTAAITAAEQGAQVTLYESHSTLGGRARSTAGPYVTNDGTHVFFVNGEPWQWLLGRGLAGEFVRLTSQEVMRMKFRRRGKLRSSLPVGYMRMTLLGRRKVPPHDLSFQEWGTRYFSEQAVRDSVGFLGPVLYDADPARLSASFVFERLLRVGTPKYPLPTRYVIGGWGSVVERMAHQARELGVRIETGARITELPDSGPVIVATSLDSARNLLGDDTLRWESGSAALLDVAMTPSKKDGNVTFDMDEGGFVGHYSDHDPTLAPEGEDLWQGQMPLRKGESKAQALDRLRSLLDLTAPGWRSRVTWQRDHVSRGRTGALDLPGSSWRDRPAIDRGDGVFLAGDSVAAPGILAEVSINSGRTAAARAVESLRGVRVTSATMKSAVPG